MEKREILDVFSNPTGKLIAVDIDGTLSEGECWDDKVEPKPIQKNIDFINSLYRQGAHVVMYTARFPEMYQSTLSWLIKYGVLFHGINMRIKPGADAYYDDKAVHPEDVGD